MTWQSSIPHEEPRKEQEEIIEHCIEAFKDKRFVVVEAGTGVGKSAIGITIARHMN